MLKDSEFIFKVIRKVKRNDGIIITVVGMLKEKVMSEDFLKCFD